MTNGIGDSGKDYYKNYERVQKEGYNIEEINNDYELLAPMLGIKDNPNRALTDDIEAGNVDESVFNTYMYSEENDFGFEKDSETVKFMFDYLDENNDGTLDANELKKLKSTDSRQGLEGKITAYTISKYFRDVMRNVNNEDYSDYILYRDAFNNGEIDEQVIIGSFNDGSISKNVAEALAEDLDIDGENASNEEPTSEWNDTVKNEVEEYLGNCNNLDNKFKADQVEAELRKKYSDPALTQALALLDEACKAATNNQGTENQTPVAEGEEAPVEQAPADTESTAEGQNATDQADTIELDNDEVPKAASPKSIDFNEGLTNAIGIEAGEPLNIEIIGKEGGFADLNEEVKGYIKNDLLPELKECNNDINSAKQKAADWANQCCNPEFIIPVVTYALTEAGFIKEPEQGNPDGFYNFDDMIRIGIHDEMESYNTPDEKLDAAKRWANENCTSKMYNLAIMYASGLIEGKPFDVPESAFKTYYGDDYVPQQDTAPSSSEATTDVAEETESTTETQAPVSTPSQTENAQKKHAILSEDQQNLIQNSVKDLIAQGKSEKDQIVEIVVSSFQDAYQDDFTAEMEEEIKQTTEYYYYDNIS